MKAVIQQIIQETDRVRRLELVLPEIQVFAFEAGQFVTITIPQLPEFQNQRSYSIASEPRGDNTLELCMVLNQSGLGTPILWDLQVGDTLEISGPLGNFILPDKIETELVFICTGTGVAPFRSMIRQILQNKLSEFPIYLIFGNRLKRDILYLEEFEEWMKQHPSFQFIPVLSREANWTGATGYVHGIYQELFANGRDARFYVCGWHEMCKDARQHLKTLGYNRRQYFFEQYD